MGHKGLAQADKRSSVRADWALPATLEWKRNAYRALPLPCWHRLGAGGASVAERECMVPARRGRVLHACTAAGERGRLGAGAVRVRGKYRCQLRRHRLKPPAVRLPALAVRARTPLESSRTLGMFFVHSAAHAGSWKSCPLCVLRGAFPLHFSACWFP